jgi:hypothetical protein
MFHRRTVLCMGVVGMVDAFTTKWEVHCDVPVAAPLDPK